MQPLARLSNGQSVLLRMFTPADREAVVEAFRRLSTESRYHRFWDTQKEIPDSVLNRFLNPKPGLHETWAAQHPDAPDEPGYGGASFWRNEDEPWRAEISLTVADEAHHTGVGTVLMAVLWIRAKRSGITEFFGHVLPDNYAMLDWVRSLGAMPRLERGQYVFRLELDETKLRATPTADRLKARLHEAEQWGL
jgi:GNAT superfamily N-acetyltransferase